MTLGNGRACRVDEWRDESAWKTRYMHLFPKAVYVEVEKPYETIVEVPIEKIVYVDKPYEVQKIKEVVFMLTSSLTLFAPPPL